MSGTRSRKPTVRDTLGALLGRPISWPADVDTVLCATADTPSLFGDDVLAPCAGCGFMLRHRLYIPAHLTKLCLTCVLQASEGEAA
jgi:hypothetical protein